MIILMVIVVKDNQSTLIEDNKNVIGTYLDGWAKGNSSIIHEVLSDSYTFRCVGNPAGVIEKIKFQQLVMDFRSFVGNNGGPIASSTEFMKFKNVVQQKVRDDFIMTGQWQIPGFASGIGMILASHG